MENSLVQVKNQHPPSTTTDDVRTRKKRRQSVNKQRYTKAACKKLKWKKKDIAENINLMDVEPLPDDLKTIIATPLMHLSRCFRTS